MRLDLAPQDEVKMPPVLDKPGTQNVDPLAALERFVVENDDLLALESLIGKFNIFDALDIARVEIRHSNFLAFILDPAESHGQGQLFLKAILMDLLKQAPAELRPLSPIELDGTDLRGVEVRREWEHIDLLVACQEPQFFIVIENKVGSHEHSNQLKRYEETMNRHWPAAKLLYVYLTPSADEPSEDRWVPYSYTDLHRVLTRVRKTYHNAIGEDVQVFLDHYLNLIGTRFMTSPEVDALCQRIYKNHRQALDLIWERVGSPASGVLGEAANVVRGDGRWHVFYQTSKVIGFVPTTWLDWLPRLGLDQKEDPRSWIVLRLRSLENMLEFMVQVRRIENMQLRKKIIELLIAELPKFGFKKKQAGAVGATRARVSGSEAVLKWGEDDDEPESDVIRAAVKKKLDELYPKLEGVPSVVQPVL
jgi:hypothetical protein